MYFLMRTNNARTRNTNIEHTVTEMSNSQHISNS